MIDLDIYRGKRVFITGHTGFKGSWMCAVLLHLGAKVYGYAKEPSTNPNLWSLLKLNDHIISTIGDIRDGEALTSALQKAQPDFVFHLAAQPIVREGYRNPVETYTTNVIGTVNILEAIRQCDTVKSFVNVTTDKVYYNQEWCHGYRENDPLDGFDPYSNSKSCSELVTKTYKRSFFQSGPAISTARAGNVIGGGDYSPDRIIPDCVRSIEKHSPVLIRNPFSIRPYQHVLEPVVAYLKLAQAQADCPELQGAYNIGPDIADCVQTSTLVKLFCSSWGDGATYEILTASDTEKQNQLMHEANFLKLDNSKIRSYLGIYPNLNIQKAIDMTILFEKSRLNGTNLWDVVEKQIDEYLCNYSCGS